MPAETLHTAPGAPKDERDVAAKLKQQYEKAQFDADQKEAFGKFDVTAPNEGEDTYQSYLDQRPANGIVRDGEGYRNTQSGQFAGEQAYETQKGDTQAYYDQLGGIENQGAYEAPHYEEMGVMQLAKEAAKARELGDKAEEATIREALDAHLTIDALKNDSETPEAAQKRYEDEIARYEALVEKFAGGSDTVSSVEPTLEADTTQQPKLAEQVTTENSPETAEAEQPSNEKETTEPDIFLNGEKVTIDNVYESPDGQKAVLVKGSDGTTQLVLEKELAYAEVEEAEQPSEDVQTEGDSESEPATAAIEVTEEDTSAVQDKEPGQNEKEQAAKKWWEKAGASIRKRAGVAYWAAAHWGGAAVNAARGFLDTVVDYGVTNEMNEDEKEKRRQDNRYALIIVGAGIAAIWAGYKIQSGLAAGGSGHGVNDFVDSLGKDKVQGGLDGLKGDTDGDETLGVGVAALPLIGGEPGTETLEVPEVSGPVISANSGDGGESLLARYSIAPEKWYDNAQTLVNQFPQDFYREGNDVRIAHTGPLSQGAQDFINSLR